MIPKLRAWHEDSQTMCEVKSLVYTLGTALGVNHESMYKERMLNFEKNIFMQSTGFKDQNGSEVFDGDIVLTYDGDFGKVVYNKELALWEVHFSDESLNLSDVVAFDVVGNIYEHKHLLEEE